MKRVFLLLLLAAGVLTLPGFHRLRSRSNLADLRTVPPLVLLSSVAPIIRQSPALVAGSNLASSVALPKAVSVPKTEPKTAPFDDFAVWVAESAQGRGSVVEGQRLAWKRREAMLVLIQNDPEQALSRAVPFEWRQTLPPEVTRFFEEQVDGRGDFKAAVGTDFVLGTSSVLRSVELAGSRFQAFVYGRRLAQPCATGIPLHGVALAGKLALQAEPLRILTPAEASALSRKLGLPLDEFCGVSGNPATSRNQPVFAETGGGIGCYCGMDHYKLVIEHWAQAERRPIAASGDGSTIGSATAQDDAWTHGSKTLLYMRVNFPDDLTEPISEGDAYAIMNDVNSYYVTNSFNLTALDTTVSPLVTLPQIKAYYSPDPGRLLADARAAVRQAGFDTANYDRDIVTFTSVPDYKFGGLAYVGGKGVWLQSPGAGVTAHELGHNYGLWHANFWDATSNGSAIGPGTNSEYGNINDTMGVAGAGIYHFNAVHKNILDWLKADAVQVVSTNGRYRLYPVDSSLRTPGRTYAAVVRKDFLRDYWLEFRQRFTGNPWLQNGVVLNWAPWKYSNGGTSLLDTTPGSPFLSDSLSREDAALVVGRTFHDGVAGVHITTVGRDPTGQDPWVEVQVNAGNFAGNQSPILQVEIDPTNVVSAGTVVHFHATAIDPEGDTLAYAWSFDDLTFSTNNLPWTARSWTNPGDHVVRCVVSDMKGGEASANVVVTVGRSGGFRWSGRVLDLDGNPLAGVLVGNGPNSAADFVGGYTDTQGRYVVVNVTGNLTLNPTQFGYSFTNTPNWANPQTLTNDMLEADFLATPMTMVNITVDTNTVSELDATLHHFTITRVGDTNLDLTIPCYLSGLAVSGGDYLLAPPVGTEITIPAGSSNVVYRFQAINNSQANGVRKVTFTLGDDTNYVAPAYALVPLAEATITILDDDPQPKPTVSVATTTAVISENGNDLGTLVFTRAGSMANDLFVNYSIGGSASPGIDYVPPAGVVLIPAGQSSATVYLQPLDDHAVKTNVTAVVTLGNSAAYGVGTPASASIVILNDDATLVTVFPTTEPALESTQAGAFTIKRDGNLTDALTINYKVGGTAVSGVNYVALNGTVTLPAGAASANVIIIPVDDGLLKPDQFVTLSLTNDFNYDVGTPGSATIFITERQRPSVTITAPVAAVSEQGDTFGQFLVSRDTMVGDLTVYLAISGTATPGYDYLPLDNPVVIPDGAGSVSLDVIPFHDLILEPVEDVVLLVMPGTNYNMGSPSVARVQIADDATTTTPGVGFCFATSTNLESQSPGLAVSLTVTSAAPVTVDYRVIGGTAPPNRYSLPQGTLTIGPNEKVGFIPLKIVNDTTVQPPQTVRVVLFNPANASLDGIKVHTLTILDDDQSSVSVTATVPNAFETGRIAGNFRLTRTGSTAASLKVNFQLTGTASAPTDYAALGTSATIPAGAAFLDLPILPVDDHTVELPQTVVMTLISAPGGAIVSPNVATVILNDNDPNALPVVSVTSTNQPAAVEGGVSGGFLFTREGATSSALTIAFAISGTATSGVRYLSLPVSVTIPAGQASVTVPVVARDDGLVEGEQTVIASLVAGATYRVANPASATVIIQDNDQAVSLDASDFRASKYRLDPGQFTFSRFGTTNTPVTVRYTISGTAKNGVDYEPITNSFVIPAGQLSATLPILPRINFMVEGPVTVTLTLLPDAAYQLGSPVAGTVIIDDNMPMLTVSGVVTNIVEGSGTNGVFRLSRTGDPQLDFTVHVSLGGTALFGIDYPPIQTNIYFTCGVTYIDLLISPTNELVMEPDESVTISILPDPAYTILSPSNAALTIIDAGTNQTPLVKITSPVSDVVFLGRTNLGLVLNATVTDDHPSNTLAWTVLSGPPGFNFSSTNTADSTIFFTNAGIYLIRLTADDGQLQGFAQITAIVAGDALTSTNTLHWPFDEGAGTNVANVAGAGHVGALFGGPTWNTNGVLIDALDFSGTNDCVRDIGGSSLLNGLTAFTLALWIRPETTNLNADFFAAADAGTNQTFELSARSMASCGNNTNVLEFILPSNLDAVKLVSANGANQPYQWQHVAVTWSNGLAPSLFINGKLDQPNAGHVPLTGFLTNCPQFIVGRGSATSVQSWIGGIDDVRVYPRALSADEILALDGLAVSNHAPVVDAGTNLIVQINTPVTLIGTVTDDGLPKPPGSVITTWSSADTNLVVFPDPSSLTNTLIFTNIGDYLIQLTADDGDAATFSLVTVTVILPTQVDVFPDIADAFELGPLSGDFTFQRNGDTNELTVYLAISGTASNGLDFVSVTNAVTFPPGITSLQVPILPFLDYAVEGDETVKFTILTNAAYFIGNGQATVTIHDSPYGLWSIQQFTLEQLTHPELTGPGADFDHDGNPNFAEYALNLDPHLADTNAYAWAFESSPDDGLLHLTLTYTRRLPPRDVQYGVFVSPDLRQWNTGTNYVREVSATSDPNGITETVKTRALQPFPSTNNLFMNVQVWLEQVP